LVGCTAHGVVHLSVIVVRGRSAADQRSALPL